MTQIAFYVVSTLVGVLAALYLPLNGQLGNRLGSPLLATAIFFSVGALTAIVALLVFGNDRAIGSLSEVSPFYFLLGSVSFAIILAATILIPQVGPGAYFVCLVTGQVSAGLLLSHFGWLSDARLPMTPLKILGAGLLLAGVILIYSLERDQKYVKSAEGPQTRQA